MHETFPFMHKYVLKRPIVNLPYILSTNLFLTFILLFLNISKYPGVQHNWKHIGIKLGSS